MADLVSSKIKVEGLPDNAPTIEIHGDNITINVNSGDRDQDQVVSELSSQIECAKEANERITKLANNRYGEIAEAFKRLHAHRETIDDASKRIDTLRAQVERLKDDNASKQHTIDALRDKDRLNREALQQIACERANEADRYAFLGEVIKVAQKVATHPCSSGNEYQLGFRDGSNRVVNAVMSMQLGGAFREPFADLDAVVSALADGNLNTVAGIAHASELSSDRVRVALRKLLDQGVLFRQTHSLVSLCPTFKASKACQSSKT